MKRLLKIVGIFALILNFSVAIVASETATVTTINTLKSGFDFQKSTFGMVHLFAETNHLEQIIDEYPDRLLLDFYKSFTNGFVKKRYFALRTSKAFFTHSNFFVLYFTKEIIFPFHTFL